MVSYPMTSSARARNEGGIPMPRARAAARLTANLKNCVCAKAQSRPTKNIVVKGIR